MISTISFKLLKFIDFSSFPFLRTTVNKLGAISRVTFLHRMEFCIMLSVTVIDFQLTLKLGCTIL